MEMKNNINIKMVVGLMTGIFLFACSEDLLIENPPHLITADKLFNNLDGFENGLNGIYSNIRNEKSGLTSSVDLTLGLLINGTDLFVSNTPDNNKGASSLMSQWTTLNDPSYFMYENVFRWLYEIINSANTIINRANENDVNWVGQGNEPDENKNRVIAEAKAMRAWAYRHLTYMFGDVPLSLEESVGSNIKTDWKRTPVTEVRQQIVADLLFAQNYIPVEGSLPGRITRGAVQTYLSEMYLTLNNPDSALYWADQVINNSAYQLITSRYGVTSNEGGVPFMDMFLDGNANREEGNTESLWTWNFEYNTIGGGQAMLRRVLMSRYMSIQVDGVLPFQITVDRGGRPQSWIGMTKFAMDLYEIQDDRYSDYAIKKHMVFKTAEQNAPQAADILPPGYNYGDTLHFDWSEDISTTRFGVHDWPWSRKIEGTDPNNPAQTYQYNDIVYMRLAETYLLKAEAQFLLGLVDEAAETINVIRSRSNATPITATDMDIDFILDERGRELLVEEHRRYTLLRTGKWLERVQAHNQNGGQRVTSRDRLFPIPQAVIDANLTSIMSQNEGYSE